MPAISILVPAYNVEPYIHICLDSILNQTFKDIEIIIIDDGSTDDTPAIIDEYARKYDNIVVAHQDNVGIVKTRSRLMKMAKGDYIGWVDGDDFINPEMYTTMYDTALEQGADVVICDYDFYPKKKTGKGKWYKPYKGTVNWHFIERNGVHWNKLVKRELIEQLNINELNEEFGEGSYELVLLFAKKIVTIDLPLYNYRVGHSSMSRMKENLDWYKNNIIKAEKQDKVIRKMQLPEDLCNYYTAKIYYAWLQLLIACALNNNKLLFLACQRELKKCPVKAGLWEVLKEDFGTSGAFVLRYCMPLCFTISRFSLNVFIQ